MVETLGTTDALVEILKVLRGGIEYCQSFREAPHELQQLADHFRLLSAEFELLLVVFQRNRQCLNNDKRDAHLLNQYICDAGQTLRNIQSDLAKEIRDDTLRNRLRWSLFGKEKADLLLRRLTRLESSMTLVVGIVSKFKLGKTQAVKLESGLSLLAARARALNAHPLRSGNPSQVHLLLASSTTKTNVTWSNSDAQKSILDSSTATEVISELATVSNNAALVYPSRTIPATSSVLRLRLKNWLIHHGLSKSKAENGLVPSAAPILVAAREGDIKTLHQVLQANSRSRYCFTIDKLTPIGVAIEHGQPTVVQVLLDNNVDMNRSFGRLEITALGQALRCREFDITKLLVERGASFSSRNLSGWSPLFYLWVAEINPSASQYLHLLHARADFRLLHEGVYDSDGWGAIHRAACFGTAKDVGLLIRFGLDPYDRIRPQQEQTECDDWTVLHVAVWYGALGPVKVLSPHYVAGPGIDVTDNDGCTPLHLAVLRQRLEIAAILLRYGADPLRKTTVAWQCKDDDTVCRRYNAVMLAAEVGRDFQQQFGALIPGRVSGPSEPGNWQAMQVQQRVYGNVRIEQGAYAHLGDTSVLQEYQYMGGVHFHYHCSHE